MVRYYSSFLFAAVMLVGWVGCVDADDETYFEATDELSAPATAGGGFPVPGKLAITVLPTFTVATVPEAATSLW